MQSGFRPFLSPLLQACIPLTAAMVLLTACSFDPLDGWQPPQQGTWALGDVLVTTETGDAGSQAPVAPELSGLLPDQGSPAGGDRIEIHGSGFAPGARVFFGGREGREPTRQGFDTLYVTTPASPVGLADVRVVNPDGLEAHLPRGFLFVGDFQIDAVIPDRGPLEGGTPVILRGRGFLKDTRILFETRLALQIQRLDEGTILALTPAGTAAGPVAVYATNEAGSVKQRDAFRYTAEPRVVSVDPLGGPPAGGNRVTLLGTGLADATAVWFADQPATDLQPSENGHSLSVQVPPGHPGAVDIRLQGTDGAALLPRGYSYWPWTADSLRLLNAFPAEGPTTGGTTVHLTVCGLPSDPTGLAVQFDQTPVMVQSVDPQTCAIQVVTAAHEPGQVAVRVAVGDRSRQLGAAFTFVEPIHLTSIAPSHGPVAGATALTLHGDGFRPGMAVRIGALPATDVSVVNDRTAHAVAPPGSPGPATVRVTLGSRQALLPDAYAYDWGRQELFAVLPLRGAKAGGTFMQLVGAGFAADTRFRVGSYLAKSVTRSSDVLLYGYSPAAPVGHYDVAVFGSNGTTIRYRAYEVFDPASTQSGTWGDPIDGVVNITVLDGETLDGLPDATVILGADSATPFQGRTNMDGQTTLSGPGLAGRVTVHAGKADYSAQSYVGFNAENLTLVLQPDNPTTTGGGGQTGGEPLEPGRVGGQVAGMDKYAAWPIGACAAKPGDVGPRCQACQQDADCLAPTNPLEEPAPGLGTEYHCRPLADQGSFCLAACETDADCPGDYACKWLTGDTADCLPLPGRRTVRCEITIPSMYSMSFEPGDNDQLGDAGQFSLTSRLGDVAVVCLAGLEDPESGIFDAYAMGVRRHVFALTAQEVAAQDVNLDIPLGRTVEVAFAPRPGGPDEPQEAHLSAFLDLGSDGVFPIGSDLRPGPDGRFAIGKLPSALVGDLYDASFTFFGGYYGPEADGGVPYAVTLRAGAQDIEGPRLLDRDDAGDWHSAAVGLTQDLNAVWAAEGERFAVGAGGRIVRAAADGPWTPQPSATTADLFALHGVAAGQLFAVGARGTALHRSGGWLWQDVGPWTDSDLRTVWADSSDSCFAAGDHRIVRYAEGQVHELKVTGLFLGAWGSAADDVWLVGRNGLLKHWDGMEWRSGPTLTDQDLYAIWGNAAGSLVIVGAGGRSWHRSPTGWNEFETGSQATLRAIAGRADNDLYAGGDDGNLLHFDGAAWTPIPIDQPTLSIRGLTSNDRMTAVGVHTFLLGPILPVAHFSAPAPDSSWDGRRLTWTFGPGVVPDILALSLSQDGVGTRWRMVIDGAERSVDLPDFLVIAGFSPLQTGTGRLSNYGVYQPGVSIDHFNSYLFGYGMWNSWTFDLRGYTIP